MTNPAGWSAPGSDTPGRDTPGGNPAAPPPGNAPASGWGSPPPGPGWGPPAGWAPTHTPGIIPLRPLGLSEILDGAFAVVRRHAKVTLAASALIVIVGQLLTLIVGLRGGLEGALNPGGLNPFQSGAITGQVSSVIISATTSGVLTGVMAIIVSDTVLGRPPTFGTVWARTRPRLPALLGVAAVAGVAPLIGLLLLVIPGVFLWAALALAPPALTLERLPVGGALQRSRRLVAGSWWRVFGIRALAVAIGTALGAVLALPAALVGGLVAGGTGDDTTLPVGALVIIAVVGVVASVFTQPFVAAVVVLLYIDRRMRAEGLDVTLVQAAAGTPSPGQPGLAGR